MEHPNQQHRTTHSDSLTGIPIPLGKNTVPDTQQELKTHFHTKISQGMVPTHQIHCRNMFSPHTEPAPYPMHANTRTRQDRVENKSDCRSIFLEAG